MDGDKIHDGVIVAGVHDESAVIAVPHGHVALGLGEFLGIGVGNKRLVRNEEPKCGLARAKGLMALSDNSLPCRRLTD